MWHFDINSKMVQDCVFARSSEFQFGVRRKKGYNPGSAGSEFEEKTCITLVQQVRSSEKAQFLSLNPGRFRVRRKNWVEPRFGGFRVLRKASSFLQTQNPGKFGVRRNDRAEPFLAGS